MEIVNVRIFKPSDFNSQAKGFKLQNNCLFFCRKWDNVLINKSDSVYCLIKHKTQGLILRIVDYIDGSLIKTRETEDSEFTCYLDLEDVNEVFKVESIFHYYD